MKIQRPDLVCSVVASSKQDGTALVRSGSTKIFIGNGHKIWIELKDAQNAIRAYAELDGPNTALELNENNNKCEIEFTAIVKAGK